MMQIRPGEPHGANERGQARIADRRRKVREQEALEPLRGRILRALDEKPSTPSDLARKLEAATETISRKLRVLRDAGLVQDDKVPGDRRRRLYALTAGGREELLQHRAFGVPQSPPPLPDDGTVSEFLRSALDRAVEMRRKTNQLDEAATRLRKVLREAEKRGVDDVALDATAELAITLRQDHKNAEVTDLLEMLARVAHGADERYGPELALPADAHRCYTLGRGVANGDEDLSVRVANLVNAAMSYQRLSKVASQQGAARWRQRQAWSIASVASNLREQSDFKVALDHAALALELFEELEDPYGRSYCLFLLGFCWRLLDDFGEAWQRLHDAHELAAAEGFKRFEADALMQMGEVRRCQGDTPQARLLLDQALERAITLDRTVTAAFAQSALGAVDFQEGDLERASDTLKQARILFEQCRHGEGLALTMRRQAIVGRRLGLARRRDYRQVLELIEDASSRYSQLRSPAGVSACHIERARIDVLHDGEASTSIAAIMAGLEDEHDRPLLALDPCLPYMLISLAREVEHEGLAERAQAFVEEGVRRRRVERESSQAPRATTPTSDPEPLAPGATDDGWFEMGGETRLESSSASLPVLVPLPV